MKKNKKKIELALKQLVEIKFLQEKDGKYKYHPNYKKILITCKGKTEEYEIKFWKDWLESDPLKRVEMFKKFKKN